jgi:proton-dependent oligopeptide transporter, POT family
MPKTPYRTAPVPSTTMPKGVPYIISNELAERFSFYGMKAILVVFMTHYLMGPSGQLAVMSEEDAKGYYHLFNSAVYFTPLFGALLADIFLGKYRTIILLSLVYCLGHLVLSLDDTRWGLAFGLGLIAVGAGGIKPCVSAHVGDQFGRSNEHLLSRVFGWFYFSINFGSAFSTLLIPWLLEHYGSKVAFAVPGVFMVLATIAFWMGRHRFVHIPPGGMKFVRETFSGEGLKAIGKLAILFTLLAPFWALFDQTGSSWVIQSEHMDLSVLGITILPSQVQAANPFLILALIPIFQYGVYPAINSFFPLTPMRKMSIGLFVTTAAFAIPAMIQVWIDKGQTPSIGWQILAYLVITAAEVMVSITALEFAYTQAPRTMKSFLVSFYLLSVSLGNLFTSGVNFFIQNEDGSVKLEGATYFWFFTGIIAVTAVVFSIYARFYKEKVYVQQEATA